MGGTNAFTYSRFDVPALCDYRGWAIWADGADMLCKASLEELMDCRDSSKAVQVVKHEYRTKHPRKYLGTPMEADNLDYPRKNWSSLILWNCSHTKHFEVHWHKGVDLHRFKWLDDSDIGELPAEWNVLVGEQPIPKDPKILHYTLGIPSFRQYRHCEASEPWFEAAKDFEIEA